MQNRRTADKERPGQARRVRLQPKSLYQIPDGGVITGIANGLSVYFNINVKVIRGLFIILFLLTRGAWAVAYFILIFIIPVAKTADDIARAHGRILETVPQTH